jgi:adenylate kinase family enzyme
MRYAVTVSGPLASGKTTFSSQLGLTLDVPVFSCGALIREEAKAMNLGDDRRTLQDLGLKIFKRVGPDGFLRLLMGDQVTSCVIEGIRDISMIEAVRKTFDKLVVVYLCGDQTTLDNRWKERRQPSDVYVSRPSSMQHEIEIGVEQIRLVADFKFMVSDEDLLDRVAEVALVVNKWITSSEE